jgi:mono/diheme cytochrome c family protein
MSPKRRLMFAAVLACTALSGCGQPMASKGAYKWQDPTPAFNDGSSARPLVPGTVARGSADHPSSYYTGIENGQLVTKLPTPVTPELLNRGQERFNIYCSPCHGADGYGHGMIVQRGFTSPPSYHTESLRSKPIGHFFDVITNGKGAMYPYASRVPVEDRWAIAAYIRALQLSQHAKESDVPAELKPALEEKKP